MKIGRGKLFIIILLIVAVLASTVVYLIINISPSKLRPYENSIKLSGGTLEQRGFDTDCQQVFNQIGQQLQEFDNRVTAKGGELDKVNSGAAIRASSVSQDTLEFVKDAVNLCGKVDGKYDITIGALRDLWGFSTYSKNIPTDESISQILGSVGFSEINIDESKSTIMLNRLGAKLDFSGYLNGYFIDYSISQAKAGGLSSSFAAIGDTAASFGQRPDDAAYAISIKDPDNQSNSLGTLKFQNSAVSSCGVYTNSFKSNGQQYWDILDPQTGKPADNGLKSVTVEANDAKEAAVLSRAFFVYGKDFVKDHLNDYKIIAVGQDGDLMISDSIKSQFDKN